MKAMNNTLLFLGCLLLVSCGPQSLNSSDYIKWMEDEDNQLRQTKKEADVTYIIQYKGFDYVSAKRGAVLENVEETEDLKEDASNRLLFDLYITCLNGGVSPLYYRTDDRNVVNERFYYYQFRFINDIELEVGEKKIAPLYNIADKGSGLNNTMSFSLAFDAPGAKESDFKLVIKDRLLGSGTVKFLFKPSYFKHIPTLKP